MLRLHVPYIDLRTSAIDRRRSSPSLANEGERVTFLDVGVGVGKCLLDIEAGKQRVRIGDDLRTNFTGLGLHQGSTSDSPSAVLLHYRTKPRGTLSVGKDCRYPQQSSFVANATPSLESTNLSKFADAERICRGDPSIVGQIGDCDEVIHLRNTSSSLFRRYMYLIMFPPTQGFSKGGNGAYCKCHRSERVTSRTDKITAEERSDLHSARSTPYPEIDLLRPCLQRLRLMNRANAAYKGMSRKNSSFQDCDSIIEDAVVENNQASEDDALFQMAGLLSILDAHPSIQRTAGHDETVALGFTRPHTASWLKKPNNHARVFSWKR
ncbi:uncharacterized protein MYCFIDRAFT_175337 [Pseudocercospora fijiensis CIRAD86]|uniref:Uncharacterized protein n=1 Tax=Pseudocercospora fijiensis (strain CIRAD86) TaxID=383855 RepID=M3AB19_PSEFD|nr:uncharacterized protein MYCFIDRAFT_175337 [Pseudocercospora fijiensis CIRAD86]EME81761.1 hypothetical protein MYCFIDRAFT_175337 [Pseudocercospora fijiensis CIRAD86]